MSENQVARGTAKRLIMDILLHTDALNQNGQREPRTSIPKDMFRGYRELKDKIFSSLEYGVTPEIVDEQGRQAPHLFKVTKASIETLEWIPAKEAAKSLSEKKMIVAERYNDTPVEISPAGVKALQYFYKSREELIDVEVEALDEMEKVIG